MSRSKVVDIVFLSLLFAFSFFVSIFNFLDATFALTLAFVVVWFIALILIGLRKRRYALLYSFLYFAAGVVSSIFLLFARSGPFASFLDLIFVVPYSGARGLTSLDKTAELVALCFDFFYSILAFSCLYRSKRSK